MIKIYVADMNRDTIPFYKKEHGVFYYWSDYSKLWLPSQNSDYWHEKHLALVGNNYRRK